MKNSMAPHVQTQASSPRPQLLSIGDEQHTVHVPLGRDLQFVSSPRYVHCRALAVRMESFNKSGH